MPGRFDGFPKFELDIMWKALYDHREEMLRQHGPNYNFEASDATHLIDEIYHAEHWRSPSGMPSHQ